MTADATLTDAAPVDPTPRTAGPVPPRVRSPRRPSERPAAVALAPMMAPPWDVPRSVTITLAAVLALACTASFVLGVAITVATRRPVRAPGVEVTGPACTARCVP